MSGRKLSRTPARLLALGLAAAGVWLSTLSEGLPRLAQRIPDLWNPDQVAQAILSRAIPQGEEDPLTAMAVQQLPLSEPEEDAAPSDEEEAPAAPEPVLPEPSQEAPQEAPAAADPAPSQETGSPSSSTEADLPPAIPTAGLLELPAEQALAGESSPGVDESLFSYPVDPDSLELTNSTGGLEADLADYLSRDLSLSLSREGPQILIMHTHGTEAYTMADGDDYTPSDTARTTDENYNMIRVGEEMAEVFTSLGLSVVHDTTLYDYPGYNGSYARSLEGIRRYLEEYPTISVVLDVHRDALIDSDGEARALTDTLEDGAQLAQVMLVAGTNDGGLDHPYWAENLTLAAHIQEKLLAIHPSFPRPVNLRSQRFNQHMTQGSLLVEVGTSGNTLQQALAGARYFAQAAGAVYLSCLETE